jgi:hypothetical protein
MGNGYLHPQLHLAEHYVQRGEIERATTLHETMAEALSQRLPEQGGVAHYNLACFYATTGRPGDALAQLSVAFTLTPSLMEEARRDQDLAVVRALPEFQALHSK